MTLDKDTKDLPRDGTFVIEYSEGWAYLTVTPPPPEGRPVYGEDVLARMKILRISTICADVVSEVVKRADGQRSKLIEWPHGIDLSAKPSLAIRPDGLSATVRLRPPRKGGGVPTAEEIVSFLSGAGVVAGILPEKIERLVAEGVYDTDVVVAEGRAPKQGMPARTEILFEGDPGRPYIFRTDGSTDLKELNFVQDRKAGDVLARVLPAEESEDGLSIFGTMVPAATAEGQPEVIPGDNTRYSDDGTEIIALVDGNAFIEGSLVCVEPLVRVDRVNYETGNLHFDGSVIVKERIADGFTIEAGGNVEIGECVGRALVSAGRDVLLKGGMNGDGEGTIKAGGNITSKYIENARISCGGNLRVQELLLNSDFVVGSNLLLRGRRGELLGGNGVVGKNLWCKQLGSQAEVQTRVSLGIEPTVLHEFVNLKVSVEEKGVELDRVRNEILGLEKLSSYAQGRRGKITTALHQQKTRATELKTELAELKANLVRRRHGLVPDAATLAVIEGTMHPGSVVAFGEEEFRSDDHSVSKTVLRLENGRIIEGGYNPHEPPEPFSED
jgi:uncharacterized protein